MSAFLGSGVVVMNFKGVYERETRCVITYSDTEKGTKEGQATRIGIDEEELLLSLVARRIQNIETKSAVFKL